MDNTEYREKLKKHIEALEKAYDNLVEILNEDVDKDDESNKIKLKDHQIKVYAEGVQKSAETANSLLDMIKAKKLELESLNKEAQDKPDSDTSEEVKTDDSSDDTEPRGGSAMNDHLN